MALLAYGKADQAVVALKWLARIQAADGSVGVSADQQTPRWPTSLAVLAWTAYERHIRENTLPQIKESPRFSDHVDRAVKLILSIEGEKSKSQGVVGHDPMLVGWPWVDGTHSWIEPTALHVLALKATGHGEHTRVAQARELLINRILPDGGCNYGNTFVFDQQLLPHIQPTGLALLALGGQEDSVGPIDKTIEWLQTILSARTTTASLCFGLCGLSAHGVFPRSSTDWIRAAYHRTMARDRSPYKMALLALAGLNENSPLVVLPRKVAV